MITIITFRVTHQIRQKQGMITLFLYGEHFFTQVVVTEICPSMTHNLLKKTVTDDKLVLSSKLRSSTVPSPENKHSMLGL